MGYKGVTKHNNSGTYMARVCGERQVTYLGSYATPEDAAKAYDEFVLKRDGIFARTNFGNSSPVSVREGEIYKLCGHGLTQRQVGIILDITEQGVSSSMCRLKKKCPSLFPVIYKRGGKIGIGYEPRMSSEVVRKF